MDVDAAARGGEFNGIVEKIGGNPLHLCHIRQEPDLLVAQMMGHSSAGILQTYAKVIDEYRRDAIRKLEAFRQTFHQKQALGLNFGVSSPLTN